ncbi:MAG: hypothetical protein OXE75_10360 [bacterium]|nr:hypothetical protein [bacterium]
MGDLRRYFPEPGTLTRAAYLKARGICPLGCRDNESTSKYWARRHRRGILPPCPAALASRQRYIHAHAARRAAT